MDEKTWRQKIDDYIEAENAQIGRVMPVRRIFCQDGSDRSGGGIYNETVTIDTIGRFARAIGDSNPLYSSPAYAEGSVWGGVIAPPLIEACVVSTFVGGAFPRLHGVSIFDAGTLWERFAPIRPNDRFTAENTYLGVRDISKEDASTRLLLRSHAITLTNQRGERAAVVTARVIIRCVPPTEEKPAKEKPAGTRAHYTEEELDKVYANLSAQFDGKFRRGATPRYWEDVAVGDTLPEQIVGPYDEADARSLFAAIGAANAFATKWDKLRGRRRQLNDPQTGAARDPLDRHIADNIAQAQGSRAALVPGVHSQALLAKSVSDWMGDAGELVLLDCECRKPLFFGDLSIQTGEVVRTYQQHNGGKTENFAELKIKAARQDGVVHTQARALVRLPARK